MARPHYRAHGLFSQRLVTQLRLVVLGEKARHQNVELAVLQSVQQHRAGFDLERDAQVGLIALDHRDRGRQQYQTRRSDRTHVHLPEAA